MTFLTGLAVGTYATDALFTFGITGVFVVLGGDSRQLSKPFAYAASWPVSLPFFLLSR